MEPHFPQLASHGLGIAAGIGAHLAYFNHGRHVKRVPRYAAATAIILCLAFWQLLLPGPKGPSFLRPALSAALSFLLGIYSSLIFYRLFLNPLNIFPGPKLARVADFWQTYRSRHKDWHEQSLALTRQYGPFVRIGSSTLLVTDPDYVQAIYSSQSKCTRGEWYSVFNTSEGITSADTKTHHERRRIWSQSFGPSSLRDYEHRIQKYVDKFVRLVDKKAQNEEPIDITRWGSYYAWDLMGDVGLAKDFNLMDAGQDNGALEPMKSLTVLLGMHMPNWLLILMAHIPGAQNKLGAFEAYCRGQLRTLVHKKQQGQSKKWESRMSILDSLLAHAQSPNPTPDEWDALQADAQVIVMAGSDTTASTLVFALYYLATQPKDVAKLREELLPLMKDGSFRHVDIQNANHLNGVINEALRFFPPGSILPRMTPPEGARIGGTYIPGNVTVQGSQYILGRSEEVFERPMEFIPERWYSKPEMVKRKDAYAPFQIGKFDILLPPQKLV